MGSLLPTLPKARIISTTLFVRTSDFPWKSLRKERRPRPPTRIPHLLHLAALETVACDQVAHKLMVVALGPQTILAELVHRAVDDALRDAEGNEEVSKRL